MARVHRLARLTRRAWRSISPPRLITITILAAYCLCLWGGWRDVARHVPPLATIGGAVTVLGCLCAIPAAWRGRWAVEAPAVGLIALGMSMEVADELLLSPAPHLPLYVLLAMLLLVVRLESIWGRTWDPARQPRLPVDHTVGPLREAQALERKAVEGALLREAHGWIPD